jgi:hypothetical protein
MATRPRNGRQAAQQGNRLAVATLVFAILGLLLGVLFPPLFLLGAIAIAPGGRERGAGAGAAQLGGPWHDHRRPDRRRGLPAPDRALLDGFDRLS